MSGTVQSVNELRDQQASKQVMTDNKRTHRRVFQVILDDEVHGSYYALNAAGLPVIGEVHPQDSWCHVKSVDVVQQGGEPIYIVTIDYDNIYGDDENPLNVDAKVVWGFQSKREAVTSDALTGAPIVNSAGEMFVAPLEIEGYVLSCDIQRNEATFDPTVAEAAVGCVNSDSTTIAGLSVTAGQALMKSLRATRKPYQNATGYYWEISYQFLFKAETWEAEVLDQGTYYLDSAGTRHLFEVDGELSQRPHNLDGSGGELGSGADAVYLSFAVYGQYAMAGFSLGSV
jgi:hypothetical protein